MGIRRTFPKLPGTLIVAAMPLFGVAGSTFAQTPELVVEVRDTTAWPDSTGLLSIYMQNTEDTVAGFELWLQLSRPDLIEFQQELDTVIDIFYWECLVWDGLDCLDSVDVTDTVLQDPSYPYDIVTADTQIVMAAVFDSTGTLISGWEYVQARSLGGTGFDVKIVALANMIPPPYTLGIPPQSSSTPLVRIPFTTLSVPEWETDRVVDVMVVRMLDHFGFSTPEGNTIGVVWQEVCDTSYYRCLQWAGEVCLAWEQVSGPPYDSIAVDTIYQPILDTNIVQIVDGQVTILGGCFPIDLPGDVNGDGFIDIADLPQLISFIHYGEPPLIAPRNGDVNGDCCLNWDDVTLLEEGGPFAECTCLEPVWCCCRGNRGNVDYDQFDLTNIADLSYLVAYLFSGGPPTFCWEEADIDGDGATNIADLTYLVGYLFGGYPPPPDCPSYLE